MATKKSDEIQPEIPPSIVIMDSDGSIDYKDVFAIGGKLSAIQGNIMQAAYRQLKGWLIRGFSTKGYLEKVPSRSNRDFVVRISFTLEFTPYTKAAIDRCDTVYREALGELPSDSV